MNLESGDCVKTLEEVGKLFWNMSLHLQQLENGELVSYTHGRMCNFKLILHNRPDA